MERLDNPGLFCLHGLRYERMSHPEFCLAAILIVWALGSLLFLLRLPWLHRALTRMNRVQWFVRWGVFLTGDSSRRPGVFELLYRDRNAGGGSGPWQTAASGDSWSWRSALWRPERYSAAAVQNIGRHLKTLLERTPPGTTPAAAEARILHDYLDRCRPAPSSGGREARLVRRFPSGSAPDEEVTVLPLYSDAGD